MCQRGVLQEEKGHLEASGKFIICDRVCEALSGSLLSFLHQDCPGQLRTGDPAAQES